MATTGIVGSRNRQDRTHASVTAKAGFRNSEGWNRIPRLIQRRAPFTSAPISGTRTSAPIITAHRTIAPRRAFS